MSRASFTRLSYPSPTMNLSDQFAFRPTGSTTAAIINLLHIVTNMLLSNPYVTVISLDFSKAFDMVRHSALLDKLNQLDIPDTVYNWTVDVLSDRSHCTVCGGQTSSQKSITAGIVQGVGNWTSCIRGHCWRPQANHSR